MAAVQPSCDLCANENFTVLETYGDGVRALRCNNCGLICLHPLPDQAELAEHYNEAYYRPWMEEQASARDILWRRRLALLDKAGRPGRLLDVGCGNGAFLKLAREGGWHVGGTELSVWAAAYGVRELGLDVRHGDILSVDLGAERFDAVTMWHVLEHTHSPRANMERIAALLKPGGVFIGALPNADNRLLRAAYPLAWGKLLRYYQPGTREVHLFHFTPETLSAMLEKCGFEVLRAVVDKSALTLSYRMLETAASALYLLTGVNWGEGIEFFARKK